MGGACLRSRLFSGLDADHAGRFEFGQVESEFALDAGERSGGEPVSSDVLGVHRWELGDTGLRRRLRTGRTAVETEGRSRGHIPHRFAKNGVRVNRVQMGRSLKRVKPKSQAT